MFWKSKIRKTEEPSCHSRFDPSLTKLNDLYAKFINGNKPFHVDMTVSDYNYEIVRLQEVMLTKLAEKL